MHVAYVIIFLSAYYTISVAQEKNQTLIRRSALSVLKATIPLYAVLNVSCVPQVNIHSNV